MHKRVGHGKFPHWSIKWIILIFIISISEEGLQTKKPVKETVKETVKEIVKETLKELVDSTSKEPTHNNEEELPNFYSTHYCTSSKGIESKEGVFLIKESVNWSETCHFSNVCVEKKSGKVIYFLHPRDGILKDILLKDIQTYNTLGTDMYHVGYPVQIEKSLFPNSPISRVDVEVVVGGLPKTNISEKSVYLTDFITYPKNWGHVLGDMIVPAYRMMKLYNLLSRDLFIVLRHRGNMSGWHIPSDNYEKVIDPISYLITDRKMRQLAETGDPKSDIICMENLLVGGSHFSMLGGMDIDGGWDSFIASTMEFFKIDPFKIPPKQKAVVIIKGYPRRKLMNPEEIAANITRDFNVEAVAVEVAKLSLKEQMKLISDATLVITGCGGVSFSATFLPMNGAALIMSYHQPDGKPERMEGYIFDRFARIKTMHYPMTLEETDIPEDIKTPEDFENFKKNSGYFRNEANVRPRWDNLKKYINLAFYHAEVSYGWEKSFKSISI